MITTAIVIGVVLLVVIVALGFASVVVVAEYQRGVVLTLGRFAGVRNPGIRFIIPALQQMERVDMRVVTIDVPHQEIITKDNVLVKVNGIVNYRVVNPSAAILGAKDFSFSTSEMAQSVLRNATARYDLDDLSDPSRLSRVISTVLDEKTKAWGVEVLDVEIKEINVDPGMIRAISRQAEAEREKRAAIIEADGQRESAQGSLDAAEIISKNPAAMQLRYLATLGRVSTSQAATIVFPFPTDMAQMLGTGKAGDQHDVSSLADAAKAVLGNAAPQALAGLAASAKANGVIPINDKHLDVKNGN